MREHVDHLDTKVWQASRVPNALIGLLAVLLAVALRWFWRRARHQPQAADEHPAGQHTSRVEQAHPESLTRPQASPMPYGTIEHVTPLPAPMTSPGASFDEPVEPVGAPARPDPMLVEAVGIAREAAEDEAAPGDDPVGSPVLTVDAEGGDPVGEHVGFETEGEHALTHYFESNYPGYVGWRWAVTVAAVPGEPVTVSEVVLLPGPSALTAPEWVPWSRRVRPGDLGAGDLLPSGPEDHRLAPGYLANDDPAVESLAREVGLGRKRVMSREGRLEAAERWHNGEFGPRSEIARLAPGACGTCGFFMQLAGSMGAAFGVCANEIAPADGRVVHAEFGCGAHSEAEVDTSSTVPVAEVVYDDATLDFEPRG
ncbi:DUF3027 domain-containing protein [Saccharopolyspora erythraea]|nr:DUF3027 domain-containing protein [Saccharopolyspora erythraea]